MKNNHNYFCKLLKHFNINECDYNFFWNGYGDYSLLITLSAKQYLIEIDDRQMCYNLLFEATASNQCRKPKYIAQTNKKMEPIKFYGENVMYKTLKYIINHCKSKGEKII